MYPFPVIASFLTGKGRSMNPKALIIDTDPGMDDAVAILTAFGSPDFVDVKMITTVGGNVSLDMCTGNALRLCEFAGQQDIPVHEGCRKAILQPSNAVFHIHGETGLGPVTLPVPSMEPAGSLGVFALIDAIRNSPEKVTLAALAPMTNIALALIIAPDISDNIDQIVAMGGSFSGGNITPHASYNFHSDPHATHIVFNSGAPVVMVGLEITRQIKPSQEWLEELGNSGAKFAGFVAELWRDSPLCFNDPCVMLHIIEPDLFTYEDLCVTVETDNIEQIGQTRRGEGPTNVRVATDIDVAGAFKRLKTALSD